MIHAFLCTPFFLYSILCIILAKFAYRFLPKGERPEKKKKKTDESDESDEDYRLYYKMFYNKVILRNKGDISVNFMCLENIVWNEIVVI